MDPVDCTRRIEAGMPVYPGDPGVSTRRTARMDPDGYRVTEVTMPTHAGTHIDAPAHTEPAGATLDEFPISAFRFDARLVDLAGDSRPAAREPLTPDRFPASAPAVDLLVVRTGWGEEWGRDAYFEHPYLTAEAAARVADLRCGVALDTPSPDPSPSPSGSESPDEPDGVPAHHALLGAGEFVLETLRLDASLPERFVLAAYPLRLDADGAPVRAVAMSERA